MSALEPSASVIGAFVLNLGVLYVLVLDKRVSAFFQFKQEAKALKKSMAETE